MLTWKNQLITDPSIFNKTVGVMFEFDSTVIVFLIRPILFVSYLTWISPSSPGRIEFCGFFGIVQPHEE